jgi:hypothetical protein
MAEKTAADERVLRAASDEKATAESAARLVMEANMRDAVEKLKVVEAEKFGIQMAGKEHNLDVERIRLDFSVRSDLLAEANSRAVIAEQKFEAAER